MKGRKDVSKTVKHCEVCQEDFGDRFSFCPVCGESLKTIDDQPAATITVQADAAPAPPSRVAETAPLAQSVFAQPKVTAVAATTTIATASAPRKVEPTPEFQSAAPNSVRPLPANDGLYHLTILQAPKSYNRVFTMGAVLGLFLLLTGATALYIYDIFNYNLDVAAVESDFVLTNAFLSEDPPAVEEKEPEVKDDKKGGGGGGGGKEETKPASKGGDAAQTPDPPIFPPSAKTPRLDNPSLAIAQTTQGPVPTKRDPGPYGIKNSTSLDPSDGPGRGGGIGSGNGQGQGTGIGTGIGSGNGSGRGNGRGNGYGDGTGDGLGGPPPDLPKPKPAVAVTEKLKILSQPKPGYTDEARKNNISGKVRLKVTFSASGQISGVSVVSGLPYGLTEKAIAAARQISFTPEKRNGAAVSMNRTIEYSFTIY